MATMGGIVELTAQIVSKECSQVASSIDQKPRLRSAVFLGQTMEECYRVIGPAAVIFVDFQHWLQLCINRCVQPFFFHHQP